MHIGRTLQGSVNTDFKHRLQTLPTLLGQKTSVGNWNIMPCKFTSHGMLPHTIFRAYLQCQTPRFSWEPTISGPKNVWPHTFLIWLQYQAPTMSDPTLIVRDYNIRPQNPTLLVRDYNIRPRQCQTPHFACETTISGPDNVRLYTCLSRVQYQAPTMSDPTLQYQTPTMSDHTLFVRDYNIRPRQCQTPGGVLPYMGYIGMCHGIGYGFWGSRSLNRVSFLTLLLLCSWCSPLIG